MGHVPIQSVVSQNNKGKYLVTTKMNGKEFVGTGETQRLAALDLKRIMELETMEGGV